MVMLKRRSQAWPSEDHAVKFYGSKKAKSDQVENGSLSQLFDPRFLVFGNERKQIVYYEP